MLTSCNFARRNRTYVLVPHNDAIQVAKHTPELSEISPTYKVKLRDTVGCFLTEIAHNKRVAFWHPA